ncbi:hypothetical protein [Paenibacillus campi]|uniref:hypothetical protein n=1 Tax=Paenibacillus campi TaxID=3106031 RepID=UPI002AFE5DDC|nr:hypothetical protein [Paenibacillus sp. SGZ-1014]
MMRESIREAAGQAVLHMGTFEAELHWREPNLATLPSLPDQEAERIVTAMDELLFAFCQPGDLLLTRYAMEACQRDYTAALGFDFATARSDLEPLLHADTATVSQSLHSGGQLLQQNKTEQPISVFRLLYEQGQAVAAQLPLAGAQLSPFAWVPYINETSQRYSIVARQPQLETVRTVNTKHYSALMKERLELANPGLLVRSAAELELVGGTLLQDGSFMIKDNYGVSGKGNLHINSPALLQRIVNSVRKQEQKGRHVQFVLERYLHKERDFSCQFYITEQGDIDILSVQWLANSQFAYRESLSPDAQFMERLERSAYFDTMIDIGRLLYRDGYFGHVCIDSMTLQDGTIEPMVEINARKSMSLIKHSIDRYLRQYGLVGNMTNYTVSHDGSFMYEQLLIELEHQGLLFMPERGSGILPLTSAAWSVNHRDAPMGSKRKGRLYLSAVAADEQQKRELLDRLETLLDNRDVKVLN